MKSLQIDAHDHRQCNDLKKSDLLLLNHLPTVVVLPTARKLKSLKQSCVTIQTIFNIITMKLSIVVSAVLLSGASAFAPQSLGKQSNGKSSWI
jgi:hypothetical protein